MDSARGKIEGQINSLQSFGTLDGPGIRYVVFMQGCPLKCVFCHNASAIDLKGGEKMTLDGLMEKIDRCIPYLKQGGITVSGGEPTLQWRFVKEFLSACRQRGLHTALDTCLFTKKDILSNLIAEVDLFLVSVKHMDAEKHFGLTGRDNKLILENIRYAASKKPVWLRYVLIEDITDSEEDLLDLVGFAKKLEKLELIELLSFSSMGVEKQKEFKGFKITKTKDLRAPSLKKVLWAKKLLEENGFRVVV